MLLFGSEELVCPHHCQYLGRLLSPQALHPQLLHLANCGGCGALDHSYSIQILELLVLLVFQEKIY
jgi:hypothetical protein